MADIRRGRRPGLPHEAAQKVSKAELGRMADTANEKNVCVEVEIAGRITRVMPAAVVSGPRDRVVIPEDGVRL